MIAALIFAVTIQSPLTMDVRAERLPILVKDLAAKLNKNLYVSPELSNRVLVVRFDDIAPELALEKIASAVDGEWVQRAANTVLTITPGKQRELDERWYSGRIKGMENAIAKLSKPLQDKPAFDAAEAKKLEEDLARLDAKPGDDDAPFIDFRERQAIFAHGPAGRAIARLLKTFTPAELAHLPFSSVITYATHPTRLQRELSQETEAILAKLRQENDVWQKALTAAPARPEEKNGWMSGDPRHAELPDTKIAKTILRFDTYGPISTINVTLTCYDATGEPIFTSVLPIDPGFYSPANVVKIDNAVTKDPDFEPSEESRQWATLIDYNYTKDERCDANWEKIVADPVSRDPLSFVPSEYLLAYAQRAKKNMVASLTDELLLLPPGTEQGAKVNLVGYLKYIQTRALFAISEDDKWIEIKPDGASGPPKFPSDREALRKLLTDAVSRGYMSVDALGDYAQVADEGWNGAAFYSIRILLPRAERVLQEANMRAYRFYGRLSPAQRRAAMAGNPIPSESLSQSARQALIEMALHPAMVSDAEGIFMEGEPMAFRLMRPLRTEPTEIFANGFPNSPLVAKPSTTEQLLIGTPQRGNYTAWTHIMPPDAYGNSLRENPKSFSENDDVWVGATFSLACQIGLTANLDLRFKLTEQRFDLRKPAYHAGTLPDDIKKKLGGD